jgi:putative Holliday junction resolvase
MCFLRANGVHFARKRFKFANMRRSPRSAARATGHGMSSNVVPLETFLDLPDHARLLGLDLGTKTIGLALSDLERQIATPLETIRRVKFGLDAAALLKIAQNHAVAGLIIGLPLNMDGSEGPRVQSTRAFVRNLAPLTPLPVAYWDERMSTMAVTRTLLFADASRAKRAEVVDKMAAAYILQGALDRLMRMEPGDPEHDDAAPDGADAAR